MESRFWLSSKEWKKSIPNSWDGSAIIRLSVSKNSFRSLDGNTFHVEKGANFRAYIEGCDPCSGTSVCGEFVDNFSNIFLPNGFNNCSTQLDSQWFVTSNYAMPYNAQTLFYEIFDRDCGLMKTVNYTGVGDCDFEPDDVPDINWDGLFQGTQTAQGVYTYIIQISNCLGDTTMTGDITKISGDCM